jgi:hypothetical protein
VDREGQREREGKKIGRRRRRPEQEPEGRAGAGGEEQSRRGAGPHPGEGREVSLQHGGSRAGLGADGGEAVAEEWQRSGSGRDRHSTAQHAERHTETQAGLAEEPPRAFGGPLGGPSGG